MLEEVFVCWHAGQDEGDGKELKALSIEAAAKKAVDIWRHEKIQELDGAKVTVFIRDKENKIHQVVVNGENGRGAPEAFS